MQEAFKTRGSFRINSGKPRMPANSQNSDQKKFGRLFVSLVVLSILGSTSTMEMFSLRQDWLYTTRLLSAKILLNDCYWFPKHDSITNWFFIRALFALCGKPVELRKTAVVLLTGLFYIQALMSQLFSWSIYCPFILQSKLDQQIKPFSRLLAILFLIIGSRLFPICMYDSSPVDY